MIEIILFTREIKKFTRVINGVNTIFFFNYKYY